LHAQDDPPNFARTKLRANANGTDGFLIPLDLRGEMQLGAGGFIEDDCISDMRT